MSKRSEIRLVLFLIALSGASLAVLAFALHLRLAVLDATVGVVMMVISGYFLRRSSRRHRKNSTL